MYINTETYEYPITEQQIRELMPNVSFPEGLPPYPYAWVYPAPKPTINPLTERIVEGTPIKTGKGWFEETWNIEQLDNDSITANYVQAAQRLQREIELAMDTHFDAKAAERRYTNRWTCATRAGYPGPFQAECLAFATWMDTCNELAYTTLKDIQNGVRPMFESVEEALAILPSFTWPE
jgi:hypothetical protein